MPHAARALALVAVLALASPVAAAPGDCAAATRSAVSPPVGFGDCPGVTPGAPFVTGTETCTMAFVFTGSDRRRYVATAGHCAFSPDPATTPGRTAVWAGTNGPLVHDTGGRRLGQFVYATMGQFRDFGLFRLDRNVAVDAQVCHFGGPVAIRTDVNNDDVPVTYYGNGVSTVPARTGDAFFGLYKPDYFYFYGAAASGDSGAPVLDADGNALGILTDLTTPFTGNVGVNRLARHLADAQRSLRIKLTLATAPAL